MIPWRIMGEIPQDKPVKRARQALAFYKALEDLMAADSIEETMFAELFQKASADSSGDEMQVRAKFVYDGEHDAHLELADTVMCHDGERLRVTDEWPERLALPIRQRLPEDRARELLRDQLEQNRQIYQQAAVDEQHRKSREASQ